MSAPFILWTRQRSASIAVFNALGAVMRGPFAESECFDGSVEVRQFSHVPSHPCSEALLRNICGSGWCFKHVYDRLPIDFNLGLARVTSEAGYRHIHLGRLDEIARLVSLGVAESEVAWINGPRTERVFSSIKDGRRHIHPLDVPNLISRSRSADRQWLTIRQRLAGCCNVWMEHMTSRTKAVRHEAIMLSLAHLGVERSFLREVDGMLEYSSQGTFSLWHLIPNMSELRRAYRETPFI